MRIPVQLGSTGVGLRSSTTVGGSKPFAVFSRHPKRADEVWTKSEFTSLCEHLHNDNGPYDFVMGFRDGAGAKHYKRSKSRHVDRVIPWAFASVAGSPK